MNTAAIEAFLSPKRPMGFQASTEPAQPREILAAPETQPLTLKDYGLVPLTKDEIKIPNMPRAKIVISESGVPIKSPEQIRQEQDALRYAAAQGKSYSTTTAEEIYVGDTRYESGGDQGMGTSY